MNTKHKHIELFIVGLLLTVIGMLTYLMLTNYNNQRDWQLELLAKYHEIQSEQSRVLRSIQSIESSRKATLDALGSSVIGQFVDYSSCLTKKSIGIENVEVIAAVLTLCTPPVVDTESDFQTKNPIYLDCFIEKGAVLAENDSTENINQQCLKFEKEISRKISISIQKSNNE